MRQSRSKHDEEEEGGEGMSWMYCAVVARGSGRRGRRERLAAVRG